MTAAERRRPASEHERVEHREQPDAAAAARQRARDRAGEEVHPRRSGPRKRAD